MNCAKRKKMSISIQILCRFVCGDKVCELHKIKAAVFLTEMLILVKSNIAIIFMAKVTQKFRKIACHLAADRSKAPTLWQRTRGSWSFCRYQSHNRLGAAKEIDQRRTTII